MALAEVKTEEIVLTPAAAKAVQDMLEQRNLEGYALRVFIAGGGCSGYQYGMALENNFRETDLVMEQYGVKLVCDDVSIDYLRGASIDFVEDVMSSGFKIDNPNAVSSCGCGNSFRTEGDPGHSHSSDRCSCS